MRTKIEKRIGPVPISLVAVLALAAFISAGFLFAINGDQTAEAQSSSCTIESDGTDATPNVVTGESCDVAGDPATIKVEGAQPISQTPGVATNAWVYAANGTIDGGTSLTAYAPTAVNNADEVPDAIVYSVIELEIPAGTASLDTREPPKVATESFMLTPSAGKSEVTLVIYYQASPATITSFDPDGNGPLTDEGPGQLDTSPSGTVPVYFLSEPVKVTTSKIGVDTSRSRITVSVGDGPNMDPDSPTLGANDIPPHTDVGSADDTAYVSAIFQDQNGRPITGAVTFTLGTPSAGAEDAEFDGGGVNTRITYGSSYAYATVTDIPEDIPINIPVTATIDSVIGNLTLEGKIVRKGNADTVIPSTYKPCDPGKCEAEDLILSTGAQFFVIARAMDSAGNDVTKDMIANIEAKTSADEDALGEPLTGAAETELWWNSLGCKAMNTAAEADLEVDPAEASELGDTSPFCKAFDDVSDEVPDDVDGQGPYGADTSGENDSVRDVVLRLVIPASFAAFMVDGKADSGQYDIEVETINKKMGTVSVTVAGDASKISISCSPDPIPANTGLTDCTVTVTDDSGYIPSNLAVTTTTGTGDSEITTTTYGSVRVAVRSRDAEVIGADDGTVMLDKKGQAMFSVLLREDAVVGSQITVNVSTTIADKSLQNNTVVTYSERDTPTVPDGELGTVTDVITGFNRGGALQVSWTKAANASGYIIIAINVNDVNNDVIAVVLNDGDLDTQNISGLTPGATYDIYVAATASGGMNTLSEATQVMAK